MAQLSWLQVVQRIYAKAGVPTVDWASIALAESGGNPKAINWNDPFGSVGVFQLNRGPQGQGRGYSVQQLQNPTLNAKLAKPAIAAAYQQGYSAGFRGVNLAVYTATHSGHPGDAPAGQLLPTPGTVSPATMALYQRMQKNVTAEYNALTATQNPGAALGSFVGQYVSKAPPQAAQAPAQRTAWHKMLKDLYTIEQPPPEGGFHPVAWIHRGAIMLAVVLLGVVFIAVGLLATAKDELQGVASAAI